jgi:hypothetical protein
MSVDDYPDHWLETGFTTSREMDLTADRFNYSGTIGL